MRLLFAGWDWEDCDARLWCVEVWPKKELSAWTEGTYDAMSIYVIVGEMTK